MTNDTTYMYVMFVLIWIAIVILNEVAFKALDKINRLDNVLAKYFEAIGVPKKEDK